MTASIALSLVSCYMEFTILYKSKDLHAYLHDHDANSLRKGKWQADNVVSLKVSYFSKGYIHKEHEKCRRAYAGI